ncbi:hypothetical protein IMSAGC004_02551 [Bacteroidaceae bacterium]|nr:hypothetical protein IMSAGC004_02551 [Bacteroidaceae bacterium]
MITFFDYLMVDAIVIKLLGLSIENKMQLLIV